MNPYISLGKVKINVFSYVFLLILYFFNGPYYIGLIIFSSFLHELGHLFACFYWGAELEEVYVSFLGARIVLKENLSSYKQDMLIYLFGILFSLISCIVFLFLFLSFKSSLFFDLCFCNLFLFSFNALPIISLDGGNVLYCFLCMKTELDTAITATSAISVFFCALLFILGFFLLKISNYNFSLLIIATYLLFSVNKKSYVGFPT